MEGPHRFFCAVLLLGVRIDQITQAMCITKLYPQLPSVPVATDEAEFTLQLEHKLCCCGFYVDGGEFFHHGIAKCLQIIKKTSHALNMNARSQIENSGTKLEYTQIFTNVHS